MRFISKKVLELQNYLFLFLIFLIPTQLGRHFWPTWSLVNGIRIDYLSPTIYVTDILILLLLLLEFVQKFPIFNFQFSNNFLISNLKKFQYRFKISAYAGMTILGLLFVSSIRINPFEIRANPLSIIKLLKLIEIIAFAWLVKINLNKKTFPQFIFVLSLSMLFQSFLGFAQFLNHGSMNGIFYFFGERNFSASTPGIANAAINGNLILRPYGTLPHPNVLAGYLLLGIILVWSYLSNTKRKEFTNLRIYEFRFGENISRFVYSYIPIFAILISSLVLLLTLSRVAILLWFIGSTLIMSRLTRIKNKIFIYLLIIVFAVVLFPRFASLFKEDSESYTARISQTKIAIAMIKDHPLLGVGLNQYLVNLPKYLKNASFRDYQPVHNVFLLVLSETGVIGFLLIGMIIVKLLYCYIAILLRKTNNNMTIKQYNNLFLILVVVVLSLFDHYFYTTQQGNLMIGLILGIMEVRSK